MCNLRWILLAFLLAPVTADSRPNIIVILADDLGYGDVKCYGGAIPTPHLDQMAREGMRFTQFYAGAPICSPARAALITGQFPGRWRINSYLQTRQGNRGCEQADFLDTNAPALPRALKEAGYATAHVGKWHLGGGRDVTNAPAFSAYGYDVGFGTYESPEPHPDITGTNWIWSAHDKVKRHERSAWMVERTLEFLRARPGQPCLVNLWLDDTHTPFVPSQEQLAAAHSGAGRSERQKYAAVLMEMDRQIGRLLGELRASALASNTLVLFLSDNGALPTFQGTRNGGLRASKLSLYEGGIRVPLIAWWPGRIPAARVDDKSVVSGLDFLPTLCAVAGLTVRARCDGEDFSAALFGKPFRRRQPLYWEYGRNTNWFKFPAPQKDRSPNLAMREGRWKYLVHADGAGAELYDVEADPRETGDLLASEPAVAGRMKQSVLAWRAALP